MWCAAAGVKWLASVVSVLRHCACTKLTNPTEPSPGPIVSEGWPTAVTTKLTRGALSLAELIGLRALGRHVNT